MMPVAETRDRSVATGTATPIDVTLLGKGSLAIRIGEWFRASPHHELVEVVPVVPEPAWSDSLATWARDHELHVVETGHYRDVPRAARAQRLGLVFSVFYDRIIRPWFIERCDRILNLHNAPLPRYRGIAPINWALKNGEWSHGVTIHEITPGIDEGPIVAQLVYSIYPERDEVRDVYERALAYGYVLFEQTMPILDSIEPRPQDESEASYYSTADAERLGERRDFTRAVSLARGSRRA